MFFYADPIRLYPATTGAWESIDLSAYDASMSSAATMAVLRVINTNLSTAYGFQFKHPTSADVADTTSADTIYQGSQQDFVVPIVSKAATILVDDSAVQLWLVGYFVSGEASSNIHKYNVPKLTGTTWSAGWQTFTMPETVVPRDARFVVGEVRSSSTTTGVNFRPYGSTDARTIANTHHLSFIIPIDQSGRFDFYCETANAVPSVYVVGYLFGGDPNTNGTDVSLTATATWTTKTAATTGKAVLIQHYSTSQTQKAGWRRAGGSTALYYGINLVAFGIAPVDLSGNYEIIAESTAQDCYVYGVFSYSFIVQESVLAMDDSGVAKLPLGVGSGAFFPDTVPDEVTIAETVVVEIHPSGALDAITIGDTVSYAFYAAPGTMEGDLPVPDMAAVGLWGGAGNIAFDWPESDLAITGLTGGVGTIAADFTLPEFGDNLDGLTGQVGTMALTFPAGWMELAIAGLVGQITGTIAFNLPIPTLQIIGFESAEAPAIVTSVLYAMNTKVLGVTEYASLGITSLCVCDGKLFGIGKDGIYEFTGQHENGFPIKVFIEKRGMDFGTSKEKRITDAYASIQSSGPYSVRVSSSDVSGTVTCSDPVGELHGSKVNIPRGIGGRYFDLAFFTTEANEFELAEYELLMDVATHRRGRQAR